MNSELLTDRPLLAQALKPLCCLVLAIGLLTGCSTTRPSEIKRTAVTSPETVLVTYRVKPGNETQLAQTLARAWGLYIKEKMVKVLPHVVVSDKETGDRPRFIEIFMWVSHAAPDNAPASVKTIWDQLQSLCEPRNGHDGLEFSEVEIQSLKSH